MGVIGFLGLCIGFAGISVIPPDALTNTPVSGAERTRATVQSGGGGGGTGGAVQVTILDQAADTNATQFNIMTSEPVKKGDVIRASLRVSGKSAEGKSAQVEFIFEKSSAPWTKSHTRPMRARENGTSRMSTTVFRVVEDYAAGEAMVSIRLAFGPQTVLLSHLSVENLGKVNDLEAALTSSLQDVGTVNFQVKEKTLQTMRGLGGNFCQPRYGYSEALDRNARHILENNTVVNARIGLPMNHFCPEKGRFQTDGPTKASWEALREMSRRKIPTIVSIWEAAPWLLPGKPEDMGRILPKDHYEPLAQAVVRYLRTARDDYQSEPEYFSFNEPDYGVNFKFSPAEKAAFIRVLGPRLKAAGLKTKFLVADTANGGNTVAYAKPLLEDASLKEYLGPVAFHSWDALSATDETYRAIRTLAEAHDKEVWCTEAGHDAQLWQAESPWSSWDNALRLAAAYARTVRLSGATLMSYWTYQNNYPLIDEATGRPFAAYEAIRMLEKVLAPGAKVKEVAGDFGDVECLAVQLEAGTGYLLINQGGRASVGLGSQKGKTAEVRTREGVKTVALSEFEIPVPARSLVLVMP